MANEEAQKSLESRLNLVQRTDLSLLRIYSAGLIFNYTPSYEVYIIGICELAKTTTLPPRILWGAVYHDIERTRERDPHSARMVYDKFRAQMEWFEKNFRKQKPKP